MYLIFSSNKKAREYIDVISGPQTISVVANYAKKGVVYITYVNPQSLDSYVKNFYTSRDKLLKQRGTDHLTEKDSLAWVRDDYLETAIANAKRGADGKLVLPIKVTASVLQRDGKYKVKEIILRPVLVSLLQSFFSGRQNYEEGKDRRIRFYKW